MRAFLTAPCLVACLSVTTIGQAQPAAPPPVAPPSVAMADCHPSSFGRLVDVTTSDGKTLRAAVHCLDPQKVQLMKDGVVTTTPLTDVRRIVTRPDPVWDGFVKAAVIPLILTAIFCTECLDDGFTYRGVLAYGAIGATWDALQSNRKTIFDSGRRSPGVTASVSIPLGSVRRRVGGGARLVSWTGGSLVR